MTSIKSLEELHSKLKSLMPEGERLCIGIDGMAGVGKSTLARRLGPSSQGESHLA